MSSQVCMLTWTIKLIMFPKLLQQQQYQNFNPTRLGLATWTNISISMVVYKYSSSPFIPMFYHLIFFSSLVLQVIFVHSHSFLKVFRSIWNSYLSSFFQYLQLRNHFLHIFVYPSRYVHLFIKQFAFPLLPFFYNDPFQKPNILIHIVAQHHFPTH